MESGDKFPRNDISLDEYFCSSRLRKDKWNMLKEKVDNVQQNKRPQETEVDWIATQLNELAVIEKYWAFPGVKIVRILKELYEASDWEKLLLYVTILARYISTDHYRNRDWIYKWQAGEDAGRDIALDGLEEACSNSTGKPYFEILVVDSLVLESEKELKSSHLESSSREDDLFYNVVVVSNLEDALIAILLNFNIQSCVVRYSFSVKSECRLEMVDLLAQNAGYNLNTLSLSSVKDRTEALAKLVKEIRPEVDLYLLSELSVEEVSEKLHQDFRRCFFGSEDYPEMRLSILKGVQERFDTPFFSALKSYTDRPTGVFHALPISRGKSISKSHWIHDYGDFYGEKTFLSETSATIGGLDSLLQPSGCILQSQRLASFAFKSTKSFFVTNGTSTANKIVLQAITKPGDMVIMAGDNHKSHHYGALITGVKTIPIKTYTISEYGLSGAVPIKSILDCLKEYEQAVQLHRIKVIAITNITFDGIAYNLEKLITACLAIKPDLVFLIDEAWFAYGICTPTTRKRSAMHVADKLYKRFKSTEYKRDRDSWIKAGSSNRGADDHLYYPDPEKVKIRIYSTQSTHKTLTALRQGSMIHIYDHQYSSSTKDAFLDAYRCHTSTSPNYQIIASLDIARRQIQLEGYELVQKAMELALILRTTIKHSKLLSKYFILIDHEDLIPPNYREVSLSSSLPPKEYWLKFDRSWSIDEFAVDPTRITIDITKTNLSGSRIKSILMDRFDIQINKTSENSILVIVHIGSTRGMITYFLESLSILAREIESGLSATSAKNRESQRHDHPLTPCSGLVHSPKLLANCLNENIEVHPMFANPLNTLLPEINTAKAYALAKEDGATEYIYPTESLADEIDRGLIIVSAAIVTPYPPGYPILLPGQIITSNIAQLLRKRLEYTASETHGLDESNGIRVFSQSYLQKSNSH